MSSDRKIAVPREAKTVDSNAMDSTAGRPTKQRKIDTKEDKNALRGDVQTANQEGRTRPFQMMHDNVQKMTTEISHHLSAVQETALEAQQGNSDEAMAEVLREMQELEALQRSLDMASSARIDMHAAKKKQMNDLRRTLLPLLALDGSVLFHICNCLNEGDLFNLESTSRLAPGDIAMQQWTFLDNLRTSQGRSCKQFEDESCRDRGIRFSELSKLAQECETSGKLHCDPNYQGRDYKWPEELCDETDFVNDFEEWFDYEDTPISSIDVQFFVRISYQQSPSSMKEVVWEGFRADFARSVAMGEMKTVIGFLCDPVLNRRAEMTFTQSIDTFLSPRGPEASISDFCNKLSVTILANRIDHRDGSDRRDLTTTTNGLHKRINDECCFPPRSHIASQSVVGATNCYVECLLRCSQPESQFSIILGLQVAGRTT